MISLPVSWSRLPVGSSASRRRGRATRARAMAARCISPPESSRGRCFRRWPSPTVSSNSAAVARCSRRRRRNDHVAVADHQRDQDVFQRGQLRQEVIELEDHAELAVPQGIAAGGGQVVDPLALEVDFALVRGVQRAQQVQQGALARAALAHDRQEFALADAHAQAAEHGHGERPLAIALVQVGGRDVRAVAAGGRRRRDDDRRERPHEGRAAPCRVSVLLITQGLHGMQPGGAQRRQDAGQHGDAPGPPPRSRRSSAGKPGWESCRSNRFPD